ncbi:CPBP family intramembrane glutamic endopeptidase [Pontibacter sp. G13]|uniref:CPBP family intramembrane glutamic endopeptidase n=1 Tax=Pontibacter sp. G13 TaxID=3074898 RepID=UPI00288B5728|nr:CPBP family intramembrane glutamic endopeptidase [Pontibacter sp. G13]WNJ16987.1 CPBP family intramembrane glutamic endopeptidase [Pontibacter sp. G13]
MQSHTNWIRPAGLFLMAFAVSNAFRLDLFSLDTALSSFSPALRLPIRVLLEGSGVFLAAILGFRLMRDHIPREMNWWGPQKWRVMLGAAIPIIALTLIGVKNPEGMNPHVFGLLAGVITWMYCVMEESFWRGYLEDELKSLGFVTRAVIVGTLWFLWHVSFLENTDLMANLTFWGILVGASIGLGQMALKTRSILVVGTAHMIVNMVMFNTLIRSGISVPLKWGIVAISFVGLFLLIREKKSPELAGISAEEKS